MRPIARTAIIFLLSFPFLIFSNARTPTEDALFSLYQSIADGSMEKPPYDLFLYGIKGFYKLKTSDNLSEKDILTLIDFRRTANEKRLWVIDLKINRVLYHTLVAHGRNSGEVFATKFSNIPNSNQSSLGFYVTGNTYMGKHGVSLKLHGMEHGINDNAEARAIVMHGADYVSDTYITKVGRLGRSFGCPAVPMDSYKEIISQLVNRTCLFIYYPDPNYLVKTTFRDTLEEEEFTALESHSYPKQ